MPEALAYTGEGHLTPIPVDDDVSSLSAILLDDVYYELVRQHRIVRDGLSGLRTEPLILLKVRAWLDLTARKGAGQHVDDRVIRKHANDVLKLAQLVAPTPSFAVPPAMQADVGRFAERLPAEHPVQMRTLGFPRSTVTGTLDNLRQLFGFP